MTAEARLRIPGQEPEAIHAPAGATGGGPVQPATLSDPRGASRIKRTVRKDDHKRDFMTHRITILILFAVVLLIPRPALSQSADGVPINGAVIDGETRDPLATAAVALHRDADSTLVSGTLSDPRGRFAFDAVAPGRYQLRVSFVGYHTHEQSIDVTAATAAVELSEIVLEPAFAYLDEVQISAEREYMQIEVDRTIYSPQHQLVSAGASARDALDDIPSVEVDIDGNISLRGNQSVTVYLNGKPAPMEGESLSSFLAGLSVSAIERIEVIPNPSAAFEPEGTAGILNIVLAQNVDRGLGGSVAGSANSRGRYGASANANYGGGPWSVFANYGLRYNQWDRSGWRFRENRFLEPTTFLEQDEWAEDRGLSHNLNTSIEFALSERNTLSGSALMSVRGSEGDEFDRFVERDALEFATDRFNRETMETDRDFDMDYRISFERTLVPGRHTFEAEVRFQHEREDETERYFQYALPLHDPAALGVLSDQQEVDKRERETELTFELDYKQPIFDSGRIELGYHGEQEWVNERFFSQSLAEDGVFLPDLDLNNAFIYREQTHSAYGIVGRSFGPFGAQVGARLEAAFTEFDLTTTGETFNNRYFSIFPSAHLTYSASPANTLRLSYSKRVRRPSKGQLNPFGDYGNPLHRRVGNPYLTPEYTHSAELSFSHLADRYTVTISPYARFEVDEISWHERITDEGVTILTFENFDSEQSFGLELIGSLSFGGWLKGNGSVNVYRRSTEAGSVAAELSNNAVGMRTRASATVNLGAGLRFQLSQHYRSPMNIPGGRIAGWTRTDFGLEQRLMRGRATLNVGARDIFGSPNQLIRRDMERYYQEFFRERRSRAVRLSFRYTFAQVGGAKGDDGRGRRGGWR